MKERILKFLANENITATKFADEIGVQRSSVSHILSGRNNPSFEFIHKILARYKYLNADWLIMGNGSMIKATDTLPLNSLNKPKINQLDLFQNMPKKSSSPQADKNSAPLVPTEISVSRKIDKILLFYSDKTFEEFLPGQNL